jgi:NADH-quinone oxidoreductase subunit L
VVTLIGAATALFAALIAFAQDDIKKVLAYSTVSQLGYMFMAVGVGAFWAAVLHLVTHAFFKACLFLGAGSVMHGNHDETNIKKLGGLRREMPWTWLTFLIATLAITGIVPLSGFFSKDAILGFVHRTELAGLGWATQLAWIMGLLGALGTAFYMTRVYLLTFEGERSKDAIVPHAHESDSAMVIPLVVLAVLSIAAIAWGIPFMEGHETVMENFLAPVFGQAQAVALRAHTFIVESEGEPFWSHWVAPLFLAWGIALAGGAAAAFMYLRFFPSRKGQPAPAFARTVRKWAVDKFYVDELYQMVILTPVRVISSTLYKAVDAFLIDGVMVRGTARVTSWLGSGLRYVQTGDAQSYAMVMAVALVLGVVYAVWVVF